MMTILRSRSSLGAGAMTFLLLAGACSSTAQRAAPGGSASPGEDFAGSEVLPPGAHVNKKGQVVNKKGEVIGTAEEFGLRENAGGGGASEGGGTAAGSGSGGGNASGGGGGGSAAAAPSGGTIKIGAVVPAGNAGAAFGVAANYGDDNGKYIEAMVDEINATGGIAGRKVEAVIAEQDQTDQSQEDETREGNEICTRMTEDEHVFMVMLFTITAYYNYACYARHQTPMYAWVNTTDEVTIRQLQPWLLPALWMNQTRMAKLFPIALQQEKALTKKMAVIGFDVPSARRVIEKYLIPGVKKRGGLVIDEAYPPPSYGEGVAAISSAILRFKQQGVNRIVIFAPGGAAWLVAAREADSQNYHPGWAISTFDNPAGIGSLIPDGQLRNTVGAGFEVGYDVSEKAQPPLTAREKKCYSILRKRAGYQGKSRTARPNGHLLWCNAFWILQEALRPATGKEFGPADLAGLYSSVGSFNAAGFPPTTFTDNRYDAISQYATFRYLADGCACFKYTSKYRKMPF